MTHINIWKIKNGKLIPRVLILKPTPLDFRNWFSSFLLTMPFLLVFIDTESHLAFSTGTASAATGVWFSGLVCYMLHKNYTPSPILRKISEISSPVWLTVLIYPTPFSAWFMVLWFLLRLTISSRLARHSREPDSRSNLLADLGLIRYPVVIPAFEQSVLCLAITWLTLIADIPWKWIPFAVIATVLIAQLTSRYENIKTPKFYEK